MFSFVYIAQKVKTTIKNYYSIWRVKIMETFLVCTWYSKCISCIHNCWGIKFYFAHQTKSLFTWGWDILDPRDISPSWDNFVPGSHENWLGYRPGAYKMVFNKNFVLSVFSILSLFAAVLYKLHVNGFFLAYCACSQLASSLQSKLSWPTEISRCRVFTWIIG